MHSLLQSFVPISLSDSIVVKLMNRVDTKYIITVNTLEEILKRSSQDYYIQTNTVGERIASYHTVYLDTEDKVMYTLHETGHKVREKIRIRTYKDTSETFLEIKDKNNHGRTKKIRMEIPKIDMLSDNPKAEHFLHSKAKFKLRNLKPHIENEFSRITLVSKTKTERLTIDLNLRFHNFDNDQSISLSHIAIIELKRDGLSHSPMKQLLLEMQIREGGFSKYCIGCAMTNSELRQNNLKERIHQILKLKEQ